MVVLKEGQANEKGINRNGLTPQLFWRPHGESNPGYRRERPIKSVFHLILHAFKVVESRLWEPKAV